MKVMQTMFVEKSVSANQSSKVNVLSNNSTSSLAYESKVALSGDNLKAYYLNRPAVAQPSFGRLRIEHLQNGAYVDEAKNVFFKLFTFKEVEKVFVEIKGKALHELEKVEDGIFSKKIDKTLAQSGDKYRFKLVKKSGEVSYCKDPYAMKRDSVLDDFSEIYDHHQFKWNDSDWMSNKVAQKVSTRGSLNGLKTVDDLKIYEMNVATVTREGNFKAAKAMVDKIADDGIFNTIELMPVENTHSYNWGYDGVDKFAPQESFLGGPDALKELIDYAHKHKINVIMDVVPNHVGPDGNGLRKAAPYINTYANGQFGDKFNFEGDSFNNPHVRDYISNACLNWLDNYHCDGLRLDLTKGMESDHALKQIAMEVRYHHPDAVLIAEDARCNMPKLTYPLTSHEASPFMPEAEHARLIKIVDKNEISLENLGYDTEWDFLYHHGLDSAVHNHDSIYRLDDAVKNTGHRVKYAASHDEIGNMDATRNISKISKNRFNMYNRVEGSNVTEKHQRAAHATQAILESKVAGEYDKFSQSERLNFLRENHVIGDVSPEEVYYNLNHSIALHKVALGKTFTTPGPKMVFQGDEEGALTYFKFFREFSPGEVKNDMVVLGDKGYEPGIKAFMDSKLDKIPYSNEYKATMQKLNQYTKALSDLSDTVPALKSGEIVGTVAHELSNLHAVHLKKGNSEVFTISNFKDTSYPGNYGIVFPKGEWREVLNSNETRYGGNGGLINHRYIQGNGASNVDISIPETSLLIFERIN